MGVAEPFAIMSIPPRDLTGRSRRFSVQLLALRAGALKEALETEYWLQLIAEGRRCQSPEALGELQAQLGQLTAILTVCVKKLRGQ